MFNQEDHGMNVCYLPTTSIQKHVNLVYLHGRSSIAALKKAKHETLTFKFSLSHYYHLRFEELFISIQLTTRAIHSSRYFVNLIIAITIELTPTNEKKIAFDSIQLLNAW